MRWSTAAVALGLLLLAGGFAIATDTPVGVTVAGREHRCGSVLTPGALVAGAGSRGQDRAAPDPRVEAACAPRERVVRRAVAGLAGPGALVLVVGWTAARERDPEGAGDLRVPTGAESR